MTPQKQTIFSDEEVGIHGNCFTACVASLFDKEINTIPNFIDHGKEWFQVFIDFVYSNNAEFIGCYNCKPDDIDDPMAWEYFDGYLIAKGKSPRGVKGGHAVIYKNGKPFFDPHPSNDFVTEVECFYVVKKNRVTP